MRIVNVYNGRLDTPGQGGGIRYLQDLVAAQRERGYDVVVLAVGTGAPGERNVGSTPVWYIPVGNDIRWPVFLVRLAFHLLRRRADYRGAIVHIHRPYFAPVARLIRGAKVVLTIHTKTFGVFGARWPLLAWMVPILVRIERLILRTSVDSLSTSGPYGVTLYRERHGALAEHIHVLAAPGHLRLGAAPDRELSRDPRKAILMVGRLAPVKRPEAALHLFAAARTMDPKRMDGYRLVLVGDGELRSHVHHAVGRLGLGDSVTLRGNVVPELMPSIYAAGDRLLLLSEWETGPFVVKEALATGLPVFATRVGEVERYVAPSCGALIPPERPEQRVQEFLEFLATPFDREICARQGKRLCEADAQEFATTLTQLYCRTEPTAD